MAKKPKSSFLEGATKFIMMGLMGTPHQPLDFTIPNECQTVLDLRKVKNEPENNYNNETNLRHQNFQPATSPPLTCFPTTTYYPPTGYQTPTIPHQIRDSSEDGSERGSISPPSVLSSPTSVTSPFSITSSIITGAINRNGKPTRPFKAYPKDPLSLPVVSTAEALLGQASNEAYAEFRRRMLSQVQAVTNNNNTTNSKMKRSVSPQNQQPSSCTDQEGKDAAYWERRRKNNEAAKRSRDARRAKEDEIAIRAAFLEQENIQLKYENATLRNEAAKLRCLLYNR